MTEERGSRRPSSVLGVFLNFGLARIVPGRGVSRLAVALESPDEDTSVAAYTALVKLGPGNAKRLLEAARKAERPQNLLRVLGDLGEPDIIQELRDFAEASDPEVASAAQGAIAVLLEEDPDAGTEP